MSGYQSALRVCLTLSMVLGLLGCEPTKNTAVMQTVLPPAEQGVTENVNKHDVAEQLLNEILLMAGTPMASNPESCKLLKLGETACGGFAHLVLYSTESTDQDALLALASQYNNATMLSDALDGKTLECSAKPQVRLSLENGLCIPRQMVDY